MQDKGVITGENNSVALANISLHYIIKNISEINKYSLKFKRYIDDILFITRDQQEGQIIINALTRSFQQHDLEITFRQMDTRQPNDEIEFLDVLHVSDHTSTWGFKTKKIIKPTAKEAIFLNGKSHHPLHIFRGIILSEGRRMRRLNEKDEDYLQSLDFLKEKCIRSNFPENLVTRNIDNIKQWTRMDKQENKKTIQKRPDCRGPRSFQKFCS